MTSPSLFCSTTQRIISLRPKALVTLFLPMTTFILILKSTAQRAFLSCAHASLHTYFSAPSAAGSFVGPVLGTVTAVQFVVSCSTTPRLDELGPIRGRMALDLALNTRMTATFVPRLPLRIRRRTYRDRHTLLMTRLLYTKRLSR